MQNRYIGDIGDYVKFAILRTLAVERSLGIVWWLFPDESHNEDGRFREYLDQPGSWEAFDPALFQALQRLRDKRELRAIETAGILPNGTFFSEPIPCDCRPYSIRPIERGRWFSAAKAKITKCDLVFLDPDNGIATENLRDTCRRAGKSVTVREVTALLQEGRCVVVYHHQTRFAGGHHAEIRSLARRLTDAGINVSGALRARPWSPRVFFVLNGNEVLMERAARIADRWENRISWHAAREIL
jgi:hypothetical protein